MATRLGIFERLEYLPFNVSKGCSEYRVHLTQGRSFYTCNERVALLSEGNEVYVTLHGKLLVSI